MANRGRRIICFVVIANVLLVSGCATNNTKDSDTQANQENSSVARDESELVYSEDSTGPTVVTFDDYSDPLKPVNRVLFKFNDVLYKYALSPVSKGYLTITPAPVDRSINNFFNNLREPLYAINHLLQGELKSSGKSLLRLGVNSTVGLLGLFDPAKAWLEVGREKTTFGQTLATYGVGYGFYLVLPVLGPSTIRDGATMLYEYHTHPIHYILESPDSTTYFVVEGFEEMAPTLENYPVIVKDVDDPYIFVRNLYLQRLMRDDEATIKAIEDSDKNPPLYD